ncbi:hypothetical protein M0R45_000535 [Rubus argutus]|uniref:Secreted protein n=1 Tax=Rubus argutus TaxID=59490 RepID=A0AAW1VP23_RUBAR
MALLLAFLCLMGLAGVLPPMPKTHKKTTSMVTMWLVGKLVFQISHGTTSQPTHKLRRFEEGGLQSSAFRRAVWGARVQCSNLWWFVTCNYDPPGNYIGQRPY